VHTLLLPLTVSLASAQPSPAPGYQQATWDIAATVKTWSAGGAAALRLRNAASNKAVTIVLASRHEPLTNLVGDENKPLPGLGYFLVARDGDAMTAVMSLYVAELKPGTLVGNDNGCRIRLGMGAVYKPDAPSHLASSNGDGSCVVEISQAALPGHYEMHISAKLVSNDKLSTFVLEPAYAYVIR
jgi:hypothetical protein